MEPEKVVLAITIGPHKPITFADQPMDDEDREALQRIKQRRPNQRIEALGIPAGSILTFSRDENVQAVVVPGNRVELDEEPMSLSSAPHGSGAVRVC